MAGRPVCWVAATCFTIIITCTSIHHIILYVTTRDHWMRRWRRPRKLLVLFPMEEAREAGGSLYTIDGVAGINEVAGTDDC
jgi:hypothetical protein